MQLFIGLDESLAKTAICVITEHWQIVKEVQIASEPATLVTWFGKLDGPVAKAHRSGVFVVQHSAR